jgi:NTE family protein
MTERALVLGGGGVGGLAWLTGVIFGLAESNVDVSVADKIIGTSAGGALGAQIGVSDDLDSLFLRQTEPSLQVNEIDVPAEKFARFQAAYLALVNAGDEKLFTQGMIELALQANDQLLDQRRSVILDRLQCTQWPSRKLELVSVNATDGKTAIFTADGSANLVDAVMASCAVPGVWPAATIDGHRYIDGGVRSMDNADLAEGFDAALILSPNGTRASFFSGRRLTDQIDQLQSGGTRVCLIEPDRVSRKSIGANPLATNNRSAAAEAGRRQGREMAPHIQGFWEHAI